MAMKHVISLGAGVQSSTMALMAACGLITPMPDLAIFADTGDEPMEVYRHLEWLRYMLPFPVVMPSAGKLSHALLDGDDGARMPFFIKDGSIANRQCTRNFKIRVIRRELRGWLVHPSWSFIPPKSAVAWIGISTDEADRQKDSGVDYIENRFPLLEDGTKMSRWECEAWMWAKYKRRAPKSSCKQCPFQDDERLERLKRESPYEWSGLAEFDARLRTPENVARFHGELYVHRSRVPLIDVPLESLIEQKTAQQNLFSNECEGMCGV